MTSVINVSKKQAKCVICDEIKETHAEDRELKGRVCDDCLDALLLADHCLNRTKGICRPLV